MAVVHAAQDWTGILLINKPPDRTSFSVIAQLRRVTGWRKIGHVGTLDPFAVGLLPVCIGRATAAVQFMESYDKVYRVSIVFGSATDTQDKTGTVTEQYQLDSAERAELQRTDFAALRQCIARLPGSHEQLPPMYSAIKKDGRPLYSYARAGQSVERKSRTIQIRRAELISVELQDQLQAVVEIECSKGTYIRTLADTIGRDLGYFAHAAELERLRVGPFSLADALDPDLLEIWSAGADSDGLAGRLRSSGQLLPTIRAFDGWPRIELSHDDALRLIRGQAVLQTGHNWSGIGDGERQVVVCGGQLIGIASLQPQATGERRLKTERVLIDHADFQAR